MYLFVVRLSGFGFGIVFGGMSLLFEGSLF